MSAGVIAAHYAAGTGASGLRAAMLAPGPAAAWLLDDTAAGLPKTAAEEVGGGATLTLPTGVTKVTDAPAGAGTGFHVANISQQLNTTNLYPVNMTAVAIAMVLRTTDPQGCLFGTREFGGDSITGWIGPTGVGYGTNGRLSLALHGGGLWLGVETNTAINDGAWHTIICMMSGVSGANISTSDYRISVDGADAAVTPRAVVGSRQWPLGAGSSTRFASNYDFSGPDLSVDFAAIAVYRNVLPTNAQIGAIHAAAMAA